MNDENIRSYAAWARGKAVSKKVDENCKAIQIFKVYSQKLDERKDRFDRLFKVNKDITTKSKNVISLLHRISSEEQKTNVLDEAQKRLKELISEQFKIIAVELENEDIYLYHRAISSGIQEFIEAYTFFNYIKDKSFVHWNYFQDKFEYQLTNESNINEREAQNISKKISLKIVPSDFILGVADLTGELMRKCFKTLSIGDTQSCFEICNFVKNVYCGFLLMGVLGNLELTHKIFTLKQSVLKMEMICYNISVRGNEIYKFKMVGDDNDTAYVYQEV